jgi:protein-L-isoaspartate(D-aspartate) O-methyltransferase
VALAFAREVAQKPVVEAAERRLFCRAFCRELKMAELSHARRVMVDNQIRTFDVTDKTVLAAFDSVPRELFVAPKDRAVAYADRDIVVGEGAGRRALLVPLILARLVQALEIAPGETALDVMGGMGYSAAILASAGLTTSFIETDAGLTEQARAAFAEAGVGVEVLPADAGLSAKQGPKLPARSFDVILINGASEREPEGFFPLLKEGGRLAVLLREGAIARALVYVRAGNHVTPRRAFDAVGPVLPGFAAEPGFVF